MLMRGNGQTPDYKHPHNERQLRFHINVRLPASDDLVINDLRTYLPLFIHHVGDLENTVYFEKLTLNTAHTPINVEVGFLVLFPPCCMSLRYDRNSLWQAATSAPTRRTQRSAASSTRPRSSTSRPPTRPSTPT